MIVAVLVAASASFAAGASAGTADDGAPTLAQPRPSWFTDGLEARALAAGPEGVEVELTQQPQRARLLARDRRRPRGQLRRPADRDLIDA